MTKPLATALQGCLIGTAVGDSLGLPMEGLSRKRIAKRFNKSLRQCLIGSWGMCSDDTEHAFFVAQALLSSKGDSKQFRQSCLKLRWWFAAIPAGIGLATARACFALMDWHS